MKDIALKQFETFEEFPNKLLKVNKDSNLFYLKEDGKKNIVRENINFISNIIIKGKALYEYENVYYDIITGEIMLETSVIYDDNNQKLYDDTILKPLHELLELKDETIYMSFNDVSKLTKKDKIKSKKKERS